jgi:histidine triad (HIT) family protein
LLKASEIAAEMGLSEKGYRTVINTRAEGGQVVFHLHVHMMGGRQMKGMG